MKSIMLSDLPRSRQQNEMCTGFIDGNTYMESEVRAGEAREMLGSDTGQNFRASGPRAEASC